MVIWLVFAGCTGGLHQAVPHIFLGVNILRCEGHLGCLGHHGQGLWVAQGLFFSAQAFNLRTYEA